MLHPEYIRAVASGGINGVPIIPAETLNGKNLPYHTGIADIELITGLTFKREAYLKVSQFIYMGALDDNDTTLFLDGY